MNMKAKVVSELPFPDREPLRVWKAHGYRCVLYRAPFNGAVNGYVRVPSIRHGIVEQVEVHGGITFGPTDAGWIGFDAMHAGDRWPMEEYPLCSSERDIWWTEDKVAEETERMALSAKTLMES